MITPKLSIGFFGFPPSAFLNLIVLVLALIMQIKGVPHSKVIKGLVTLTSLFLSFYTQKKESYKKYPSKFSKDFKCKLVSFEKVKNC